MTKKITALLLAVLMLCALTACSQPTVPGGSTADIPASTNDATDPAASVPSGIAFKNEDSVATEAPASPLNAAELYESITYVPQMFYGDHRLLGGENAVNAFGENSAYFSFTHDGAEHQLTTLPYRMEAGKNTTMHQISRIKGHDWMRLSFLQKTEQENLLYTLYGAYTLEGHTLHFTPLDSWEVEEGKGIVSYIFSDVTLDYEFAFNGRDLTLSADGASVTLTTGLAVYEDDDFYAVDCYLSPDSKSAAGLDSFSFLYNGNADHTRFYVDDVDENRCYEASAVLSGDGLFTMTLPWESGAVTQQYLAFYCGEDGLVLTDGTDTYCYNDNWADRNAALLTEFVAEDQTEKLEEMNETALELLVEKKENLLEDLTAAFTEAGIQVKVDPVSGELAMDASILFGGDSAELTAEGKTFLDSFITAYTSIVFSEKYTGFVEKTLVEGHTAPVSGSTYESGLPLSEERANAVREYCLSADTGVDAEVLSAAMESIGYSNSKPILDDAGEVDMDACRRVSFRFLVNLDQQG